MATIFGPTYSPAGGATNASCTDGVTVWRAFANGGGSPDIVVEKYSGQGSTLVSTVTIDTAGTPGEVMLNEPFCRDRLTGRIHLTWERNANQLGLKATLNHRSSIDDGATWSALHVLDDGTVHGNSRFYRVGIIAFNGYLSCVYTSSDSGTFLVTGLYEVHSSDNGATWSAPAKLYTTPVEPTEPNISIGIDGTAHVIWYDPQVVANQGGNLYYAQGAFNGAGWTWDATITQITTGEVWGRPRVFNSNGIINVIGNTNWGGSVADVGYKRSADNGRTWAATVTLATHGTGPLEHPWGEMDSERAAVLWLDKSTAGVYGVRLSTDAGLTWATTISPFTTTSTSDAPRIMLTNDLVIAVSNDNVAAVNYSAVYPLFAPDPQATASIDTFTRADENPMSDGGKWSADPAVTNQLRLVSNQARRQSAAGSFDRAGSYRNDVLMTTCSCEVYVDTPTSGGEIDLIIDNANSLSSGYFCNFQDADFGNAIGIQRNDLGVGTQLFISNNIGMTSGDSFVVRADQNDVSITRKRGGNWAEVARATDKAYRSGRFKLNVTGNINDPIADNFGGGQLFVPLNTVAPSISGRVTRGGTLTAAYGTWATTLGKTPTRYRFQWQQLIDRAVWVNITRANLRFYSPTTDIGTYRVVVTGINSVGSTVAISPAVYQTLTGPFATSRPDLV